MAEEAKKSKIQDTEGSGFGTYKEANGGGTPVGPGTAAGGPPGRVGWDKRNVSGHREKQARTDDGKFTYSSVNGKELSPTSDPTRGKTVNPLLTGGKNGVLIEDVEEQFGSKSGAIWDKYKDKWYQKGGEFVLSDLKTHVSARSVWEVARGKYDSVKGEFQGESELFKEVKTGKKSAEEIAARQKAEATGSEQAVLDKAGGIKIKPGVNLQKTYIKPQSKPKNAPSTSTVKKETEVENSQIVPNVAGSLMHSSEQLNAARQLLTDNGVDLTGVSDEQLDAVVDDYIDFSASDTSNSKGQNQSNNEEKESEIEKKIKSMGFSDK